ncbi:MAG: 3-phosphoshikimate 1-carboxyvinyltransferase [Bacteroidota bacterium]
MIYHISKDNKHIQGTLTLNGSKSISNRALIIQALADDRSTIDRLSTSRDTVTMQALLAECEDGAVLDTGAAGTTFRFLTAYLALQEGTQILTGSERMKQRPIGVLVEALRKLGADIEYLETEGYPPLKIKTAALDKANKLSISAGVSSQYISALLMIAPSLPSGLSLELEGKIVSLPYIEMTLRLMEYFGVEHHWNGQTIEVKPQSYQFRPFTVEADWSAASYYYAIAALADSIDLQLNGLFENSLQGDSVLPEMMKQFGVESRFTGQGVHLSRPGKPGETFHWDFIQCPDVAQTLAVICGGLGVEGTFTGLETLYIKETDRIAALKEELAKVKVQFSKLEGGQDEKEYFCTSGKAQLEQPIFATYEDHRMAMAFAPLAMLGGISVAEPMVVVKSYPKFWEDLEILGFEVKRPVEAENIA